MVITIERMKEIIKEASESAEMDINCLLMHPDDYNDTVRAMGGDITAPYFQVDNFSVFNTGVIPTSLLSGIDVKSGSFGGLDTKQF